jgi:hypothetical protein
MLAREAEVLLEMNLRADVSPRTGAHGWAGSFGNNPDEPKPKLRCRDVFARNVLNAIVASSDRHVWIATFPGKIALTTTGFLEEVPVYASTTEQPFWVLLHWGDKPLQ